MESRWINQIIFNCHSIDPFRNVLGNGLMKKKNKRNSPPILKVNKHCGIGQRGNNQNCIILPYLCKWNWVFSFDRKLSELSDEIWTKSWSNHTTALGPNSAIEINYISIRLIEWEKAKRNRTKTVFGFEKLNGHFNYSKWYTKN